MAGRLLSNIVPLRTYDFSGLGTQDIRYPLVDAIDVSDHTDGILIVRIHSASIASGNSFVEFGLWDEGFLPGSLDLSFLPTSKLASVKISFNNAPILLTAGVRLLGSAVTLMITGNATGGGSVVVTASIDLCLRSWADSAALADADVESHGCLSRDARRIPAETAAARAGAGLFATLDSPRGCGCGKGAGCNCPECQQKGSDYG